tara:strand:- start:2892 stop:3824 length:933 start_codon:yes stop_codon:yes gene_type:complete
MISVVAPVYNEEKGIETFIDAVVTVLEKQSHTWELLLVNDGSIDSTLERIKQARIHHPEVRWVNLSRNYGHQAAVTAAIQHASGDAVIVMDADMQDPPHLIDAFIQSWEKGNQVIFARRTDRAEKGIRRLGFDLFHKLFRYSIDFPIPANIGVFCLLDRKAVDQLNRLPERNRFLPGLYSWVGFKQDFVEYARDARQAGEPKQTFKHLYTYALDGVLSFSYKPIRLLGSLGIFTAVGAFIIALYFTFKRLMGYEIAFTGFTTLVVLIGGLGGLILFAIALIGEYIARIYDEVKNRPIYIVTETSETDENG